MELNKYTNLTEISLNEREPDVTIKLFSQWRGVSLFIKILK